MKSLIERLRELDFEPRSYSGRAMYGKQCVGVSGDSQNELQRALESIVEDCLYEAYDRASEESSNAGFIHVYENASLDELKEFVGKLLNYKQDQLGLGMIYYWPSIKWEEEEE